MGQGNLSGLTLQVNCAACHGLLAWVEREGLLQEQQLVTRAQSPPWDRRRQQQQTLAAATHWALECLGVNGASQAFWRGWSGEPEEGKLSRDWQLGQLCRTAPTILRQASANRSPMRQAAMYHCYENLLLNPDQSRPSEVDAHVDNRGDDLELSEAVYHHNFKQPLKKVIDQIVAQHMGLEPVTIIDVGAGSGGMLLDVANSVQPAVPNVTFVAIDPSDVAREACRRKAQENPHIAMHVAEGSIECPNKVLQTLKAMNIPSQHCIVLAKAALHDRTLSPMRVVEGEGEEEQEESRSWQTVEQNYVYRDEDWKQISKQQVIADMIAVLNKWKQAIPGVKLIILESHILPTHTINSQISRIALLPAYLSHSLSAQYMLSANDHHNATLKTDFKAKHFIPIQVMPDQNALMSVTLLED